MYKSNKNQVSPKTAERTSYNKKSFVPCLLHSADDTSGQIKQAAHFALSLIDM